MKELGGGRNTACTGHRAHSQAAAPGLKLTLSGHHFQPRLPTFWSSTSASLHPFVPQGQNVGSRAYRPTLKNRRLSSPRPLPSVDF